MSEGRKPPEQASLDAEFEEPASAETAADEPSGLDAIPLIQESKGFPDQDATEPAPVPTEPEASVVEPEPAAASVEEPAVQETVEEPEIPEEPASFDESESFDEPGSFEEPDVLLGRFPGLWVKAGLADLAIHVAVMAVCGVAAWQLGLTPAVDQWPGYLGFAACFSFLYTSLPLAFWGQTPGMATSGLRAADGERQLAFSQTTMRWLAAWLTVATLGLPWLLARSGRPRADRLSRSETLVWEE